MGRFWRSLGTAFFIAFAIQCFTVGVLAPRLPREVLRPGVEEVRTLRFPAAERFRLHSADGAVQVGTHGEPEILITATIRAYTTATASPEAVAAYVAGLLDATASANLVDLVAEPAPRPEDVDELRLDFSILVPPGTDLQIDGANGNVLVGPGCGAVVVAGNNSDITVLQAEGEVLARSVNGRIRVEGVLQESSLETVNGSIYATVHAGGLLANTTNGAVVTTLLGADVPFCDLTSMNGGITLVLSTGCSATIQATSERGSVLPDLTVPFDRILQRRRHLEGTIGTGGTRVTMNSLNGNIAITRSST
jgi:hypothetical protein